MEVNLASSLIKHVFKLLVGRRPLLAMVTRSRGGSRVRYREEIGVDVRVKLSQDFYQGHRFGDGGGYPGWVASSYQGWNIGTTIHAHSYGQFRVTNELFSSFFGMSVDCGRKQEYPEKTHPDMGRTCKLHTECGATALTTAPPCCPYLQNLQTNVT